MTCMHDRDEQCFMDCPNCPRAKHNKPDADELYDVWVDEQSEED